MSKFTFNNAGLQDVLKQANKNWLTNGTAQLYDEKADQPPSLWLVGDQGVYVMANSKNGDNELPVVCYANECNPETMEFDDWYDAKRNGFGGDDGADNLQIQPDVLKAIAAGNVEIEVDISDDKNTMDVSIIGIGIGGKNVK